MECRFTGLSKQAESVLSVAKLPDQRAPGARFPVPQQLHVHISVFLIPWREGDFSHAEIAHPTLLAESTAVLFYRLLVLALLGLASISGFFVKNLLKLLMCLVEVTCLKLVDYKLHGTAHVMCSLQQSSERPLYPPLDFRSLPKFYGPTPHLLCERKPHFEFLL